MRRVNSIYHIVLLIVIGGVLLLGCQEHQDRHYSRIRFANFLLPEERVKIEIEGPEQDEFLLNYGESTSYRDVTEGRYTFKVFSGGGSLICQKKLGVGKGSKLTVTVSGILPEPDEKRQTLKTKLVEIFEGAAAHPANAAMPVMEVFLDRFEGSSSEGKLKVVNMAPAISAVDLYVEKKKEFSKVTTVSYPMPSSRDYALKNGVYPVKLRFKGSSVTLFTGTVTIEAETLTTLYIHGKKTAYPYSLEILELRNR